jgi:hypothetical protein
MDGGLISFVGLDEQVRYHAFCMTCRLANFLKLNLISLNTRACVT